MKRRLLASILSFVMVLSLLPVTALARGEDDVTVEMQSAGQTVKDIYDNEWTFTTSESGNSIEMTQDDNTITATLGDNGVLTFSGTGTMPVLNNSTDSVSGSAVAAYPWAGWSNSVTKIVIADGITSVGAKSFITWPNVTAVELGKDVATIGAGAFAQMANCSTFTVDSANTFFKTGEDGVLYSADMSKLYYYPITKIETDFTVPDSVTELGYNAICRNTSLQTISFAGDNVLHLGYGSLFGNTALTTVNLSRSTVTFDGLVFSGDTALKVVYCKTAETKSAANKLMGETQGESVAILEGGEYGLQDGDYIYAVDSEGAIICKYTGDATELVLPDKLGKDSVAVKVIGANAFANLEGSRTLIKVTIPESVESIEQNAFLGGKDYHNYNSTLTDVTILGTDVEIGNMAFGRHNKLRIDMTSVESLKADLNAFSSVSKIIVSKDAQEDMRTALAENTSVNQNTKVYIDTDENNAFYWHYVNDEWVIVSSGTSSFRDEQGLIYTVKYTVEGATVTATAEITGYEKPEGSTATELVIPKTLPFADAEGNEAQATVVSASGLRGIDSKNHVINGIKTLTIAADLQGMHTTFVYWDDLETINVTGDVKKVINCFGGGTGLKRVYFENQDKVIFGSSVFGSNPKLDVIDISGVKNVEMESTNGYSNAIANFYGNSGVTMVYVGSQDVYDTINEVTFNSTIEAENGKPVTKSGFSKDHNIIAITNGGTFENPPTSNTTLATPSKEGCKFIGWYTKDGSSTDDWGEKVTADTTLVAGQTYYAKYGKSAELSTDIADKTFAVGADPVEFTFTSTAHDDVGTMVKSYFEFSDPDAIQSLEYFETTENKWLPLNGTAFGPVDTGYPMLDATSKFRVSFKKAGDYTLTVSCKTVGGENETVVCSTSPIAITVAPKSIAVPAEDGTKFVYTGSAQTYNITENPAYTVTGNKQTNAGTYTVTVSLKDKANTVWDDEDKTTADKEYTFTIAKAEYDMTGVEFDDASYTYDGNAKTLVISGTLPAGVRVTYQDNTLTNVGKTTATAHFTGDATNYEAISDRQATLTITKANQTKPEAPTLKDRSYTSITLNEVAANSNGAKAEYSMDGENWQDSPEFKGLTSGTTYTFYVRYAETDNYNASPASDAAKFTTRRHSSAAVTPTPTPEPEPTPDDSSKFVDVPANAYFADAVKWAVDKGITNGLSDTMFGPYESCTRAQIVTFLWRAAGFPEPKAMSSFSDIPANAYYAKAVAWAVENGITNGMTETTFAPDATCTRGQSVTFLYRALKGTASGSTNFTDVPEDAFYADAVNWAVANNVTNGTSATTFSPNADCTRAEIVTFLYRAYQGK